MKTNTKVIVYSSDSCPWCDKAKDFLRENKIKYEEKNVEIRENAQELIKLSGQTGIPVIVIGKEVIIGFDVERIKRALKLE